MALLFIGVFTGGGVGGALILAKVFFYLLAFVVDANDGNDYADDAQPLCCC